MFQILLIFNTYCISFLLSNSLYFINLNSKNFNSNTLKYKQITTKMLIEIEENKENIQNNNYIVNYFDKKLLRIKNIKKNIVKKFGFLNIQNIKNIEFNLDTNIENAISNFAFEPSLIINKKTDVYVHIEKLYTRIPIYHIGVSFFNGYKTVRYDYRPFNDNGSYITNNTRNNETFKNNIIRSKTIYWCQIDYSLNYIDNCEQEIVSKYPKYRLGVNDCRHYAHRLTSKTTSKPTPIWKLYKLWNSF